MPSDPAKLQLVPRQSAQLKGINEKIAALAAIKPYNDVYGTLSFAARLAGDAIAAATELQQMPGIEDQAFQPTLEFWHRLRDYNYAAALGLCRWQSDLGGSARRLPLSAEYKRGPMTERLSQAPFSDHITTTAAPSENQENGATWLSAFADYSRARSLKYLVHPACVQLLKFRRAQLPYKFFTLTTCS
jgi:hypothetical protein